MDSSRGVSFIVKLGYQFERRFHCPAGGCYIRTGVDSVEIVEIGSKSKPVNRPLYVFLDVVGRVSYLSFGSEDVKSTFGGHCVEIRGEPVVLIKTS
jgi:hypothetical protein